MKYLRYLRLASICSMFASTTLLHADVVNGIDVVSQSYSVDFQWDENWWLDTGITPPWYPPYPPGDWSAGYEPSASGNITGGYSLSTVDGSPIAASCWPPAPCADEDRQLWSEVSIGRFSFQHSANAPDTFTYRPAPLGWAVTSGGIETSAQGIWVFRPTDSSLNVHLEGRFIWNYGLQWASLTIKLEDLTVPNSLLEIVGKGMSSDPFAVPGGTNYVFAVDPSHLYEFSISGWSDIYDNDLTRMDIIASITSVPEPSVLGLMALAAGIWAGRPATRKSAWVGREETQNPKPSLPQEGAL